MLPYLKALFTDQGVFLATIRTALGVIGLGVESGKIPVPEEYQILGLLGVGAALFMRSSVQPGPKNGQK